MSRPRTIEEAMLAPVEAALATAWEATGPGQMAESRLQALEAVAARIGGFDFDWYQARRAERGDIAPILPAAVDAAAAVVERLQTVDIPPSLALAALARPELTQNERRNGGVYYTDFRLARFLAAPLETVRSGDLRVLDAACGSGILLVAAALTLAGGDSRRMATLIGSGVQGADLSSLALRGAALSLASLTNDRAAIQDLLSRLHRTDSLLSRESLWQNIGQDGFDVVIGNPPWEKLKASRHELLTAAGADRHYGAEYDDDLPDEAWEDARQSLNDYIARLDSQYEWQGAGERDLYKFFLELSLRLTRPGGRCLLLVPAGLIRSLGTKHLRESLLQRCSDVEFTVLENRARFFSIDTRFKFVALDARVAPDQRRGPVKVTTATGTASGVITGQTVQISRAWLYKHRPDLSVPEIRSEAEWGIFRDVTRRGGRLGDSDGPWRPVMMREVDMTRDRPYFQRRARAGAVPLLEGRMVHQYRHAAKQYVSGTGRRADWRPTVVRDECIISPQFWYPMEALPEAVQKRVAVSRIGFCDITGQTNERTMLAARIPANVVCGNKVPTILFEGAESQTVADCWLAIANSLTFDWLLRRVVTTTVNYFLLLDMPFPEMEPTGREGKDLADLAVTLSACQHTAASSGEGLPEKRDLWAEAELRAKVEWRVLGLYGHAADTLALIMNDFPLLDRAQPPLPGEDRSTVTRDFTLLRSAEALGGLAPGQVAALRDRVERAREAGALPFIPSHLHEVE